MTGFGVADRSLTWSVLVAACALLGLTVPAAASAASDVYVANGHDGTVSAFATGAGGALTQQGTGVASGTPQPPPCTPICLVAQPYGLAMSPNSPYLYASNAGQGTISTFQVGSDGSLTPLNADVTSGSGATSSPLSLATSPDGKYLFAANHGSGTISTFKAKSGVLSQVGSGVQTGLGVTGVAVAPDGLYLFTAETTQGTVSSFTIGTGGALTPVSQVTSGASSASAPCALAVSPDGQYLYAANEGLGTISTFQIGSDGSLTQLGSGVISGADATSAPDALAMSPNGQYLYAANYRGTISTFQVSAGGALTQLGTGVTTGASTSSEPFALALSPDGSVLYVSNTGEGTISTFAVGAGGMLTEQGADVISGASAASVPVGIVAAPDQGPTAKFSFVLTSVGAPSRFTARASTAGSAPIASYSWQFGDKTVGAGVSPTHTYARAGLYTVTLTITDSDQCSTFGAFTGSIASCMVDSAATVSHQVAIGLASGGASAQRVTFGNQRITLATPPPAACHSARSTLPVSLSSATLRRGIALVFKSAAFYIDGGVVRRGVRTHRANATAKRLPAAERLSLSGLRPGTHTLAVALAYRKTGNRTVTKTLKATFTVSGSC